MDRSIHGGAEPFSPLGLHTYHVTATMTAMEATGTDAAEHSRPPSPATRDWSELPLDAIASVLAKVDAIEVLMGAGLVCRSWLAAAKVPDLWRCLNMARHKLVEEMDGGVLCAMAKVAVDRSGGHLEVFVGKNFVSDELLKYIGDRSPRLRVLGLASCWDVTNEGFTELVTRSCPLLEDLALSLCPYVAGRAVYEATGRACPRLRRFALRQEFLGWWGCLDGRPRPDREALGIAAMRELRCLTLVESEVTDEDLAAVVDACPHLEHLCLRRCYNVFADDALRAKCAGIKDLTLPCPRPRVANDEDWAEVFVATDCARDFDYWSD